MSIWTCAAFPFCDSILNIVYCIVYLSLYLMHIHYLPPQSWDLLQLSQEVFMHFPSSVSPMLDIQIPSKDAHHCFHHIRHKVAPPPPPRRYRGGGGYGGGRGLDLEADLKAHRMLGVEQMASPITLHISHPFHMLHSQGPRQTFLLRPLRPRAGGLCWAAPRAVGKALWTCGHRPPACCPSRLPTFLHYPYYPCPCSFLSPRLARAPASAHTPTPPPTLAPTPGLTMTLVNPAIAMCSCTLLSSAAGTLGTL